MRGARRQLRLRARLTRSRLSPIPSLGSPVVPQPASLSSPLTPTSTANTFTRAGSAPIAPHVIEFLRVVFGSRVLEGYGQTENSAACSLTSYDDQASLGHVGGPLACNDLK